MRKETSAGVKSGAIAGLLFIAIWFTFFFGLSPGGTVFLQCLARYVGFPLEFVEVMMIVGLVISSFVIAGLGAILGVVFARFVNRLPTPSTYTKALGFAGIIFMLISLPGLVRGRAPDIYFLAAIFADSGVFSFLFNRWTRHQQPSPNVQPPTS